MISDWEQHLEKQDRKARLARRIFHWGIFCILLVAIIFRGIALIPESSYETPYTIPTASNILYVDSNVENSGNGRTWSEAIGTINEAIDLSGNGDIIYIASGHTETLTGSIDIYDSGITIIGLGYGENRPLFIVEEDL